MHFRSANDEDDRTVFFKDITLIQNLTYNDTVEVQLPNYFVPENFEPGSYAFIYRVVNVERPVEVNMANNVRADVMIVSEDRFRKTDRGDGVRSEEHTSELQSRGHLVCS